MPYVERSLRALSFQLEGDVARMADSLQAADAGEQWDGFGGADPNPDPERQSPDGGGRLPGGRRHREGDEGPRLARGRAERGQPHPQVFAPFAYLKLARIEEAQGLKTLAREHYAQFLRRYDRPVTALQPPVDQASAALARLSH